MKEIENNQKSAKKSNMVNKPNSVVKRPSSSLSRTENRSRINSSASQQSNSNDRPTRSAVSFVSNTAKREAARRNQNEHARRYDDYQDGRSHWPPKKYQHVQGSGYGTRWKPETVKRNPIGEFNRSQERQFSKSRSPSGTRPIQRNLSNDKSSSSNPFANFNEKLLTQSGLLDDAFKSQELITKLKGKNMSKYNTLN